MLVYVALFALLFFHPVYPNICSDVYNKSQKIIAKSETMYRNLNCTSYNYYIKAPSRHYIAVNISELSGFGNIQQGIDSSAAEHNQRAVSHMDTHLLKYRSGQQLSHNTNQDKPLRKCSPKFEIVEIISGSGMERSIGLICPADHSSLVLPQVFQSSMSELIIRFSWNTGSDARIIFTFSFLKKDSNCDFKCANGDCLFDDKLVCNSYKDCFDGTDELQCPVVLMQPVQETHSGVNYRAVIFGVMVTVLSVSLLVVCIICNRSRAANLQLRQQLQDQQSLPSASESSEHHQLHTSSPHQRASHEVVYVPHTNQTHDQLCQPSLTSHHFSRVDTSDTRNLPLQIPISLDGEEGYENSQRNLQYQNVLNNEVDRETVNPPPNRTVFNSEETFPPPYRSYTVGHIDRSRMLKNIGSRSKCNRDGISSLCVPYSQLQNAVTPTVTKASSTSSTSSHASSCSSSINNNSDKTKKYSINNCNNNYSENVSSQKCPAHDYFHSSIEGNGVAFGKEELHQLTPAVTSPQEQTALEQEEIPLLKSHKSSKNSHVNSFHNNNITEIEGQGEVDCKIDNAFDNLQTVKICTNTLNSHLPKDTDSAATKDTSIVTSPVFSQNNNKNGQHDYNYSQPRSNRIYSAPSAVDRKDGLQTTPSAPFQGGKSRSKAHSHGTSTSSSESWRGSSSSSSNTHGLPSYSNSSPPEYTEFSDVEVFLTAPATSSHDTAKTTSTTREKFTAS